MAKYYAVFKGKSGGNKIYTSWDECKKEVIGFKGAVYKSFQSKNEAEEYLKLHNGSPTLEGNETDKNASLEKNEEAISDKGLCIYVDGSYNVLKEKYSYGMVAVINDEIIYKDKGVGESVEAAALRNVSGEVMGAMRAVDFALNNDHEEVSIYFDYQGIESWALGTWKRNNQVTKNYHEYMQKIMKKIKVKFVKVKGHSGDKYNDMADSLAKAALEEL
ncbi:viroplasmin family protein [Alloiococcus sp. CFN-8]|uniref:ribonuclease H1 domain-containing protein n=1 Tax=Alloiococcus sp. CFN-8 TaxID=3416081 RepID=UPI003CEC5499